MVVNQQIITPLPGKCFVRLEPHYKPSEHGIIIPERVLRHMGHIGTCVHANGKADQTVLVGKRVVVESGYGVQFTMDGIQYLSVKVCYIICILPKESSVLALDRDTVKRCPFCKSKGEGNMITVGGVCTVCGRMADGRKPEKKSVTVSPEARRLLRQQGRADPLFEKYEGEE